MTILIPPVELGLVLDLKSFEKLYINYETNTINGIFLEQEFEIYHFTKVGITMTPSMFDYKVTASAMGLIIQTLPK